MTYPFGIDMSRTGVYQITNTANGNRYIGSSTDIRRRRNRHFAMLRKNTHPNAHLQAAWNKYGEECFVHTTLMLCEIFEVERYEQAYLDILKPEYNIAVDVKASMRGVKFSKESIEKLRLSHLGHVPSEETREKLSLFQSTRVRPPCSEETKEKIRQKLLGRTHTGCPRSEETKEKLRLAKLGTRHSEETRAKMSASQKANPNNSGRFVKGGVQ